ncbi:MAG: S8 family peptidase, partial [Candidatus Thermoplasmatota archaeon]
MLTHKNKIFVLTITAFLILSTIPFFVNAENNQKVKVIIGFKEQPNPQTVKKYGGEIKYQYSIIDSIAATIPEKAINALQKNLNIEYVEEDHQFNLLEQTFPWGVDRIDADVAHSYPNQGSSETDIAIIDTGIDYDHPDLNDNYAGGYDYVNSDSDPMDDNGHGTHCAGIAAAENNSQGVIGVAPEADLYGVKVLDSTGSGYLSDVAAGVEWAMKGPDETLGTGDDAEVISMSLGGGQDSTLKNAVDTAYDNGCLLVAAAGNDYGGSVSYPASYSSVVAVSAINSNDELADFSNYGSEIELTAPGVDIYSTYWDDTYTTMDGTSMACPHVSGTAALVFATEITDENENGRINDEIRDRLHNTAEDLGSSGWDQYFGYGLVDAEAAAASIGTPPSITVKQPDGGEIWGAETIQNIKWTTKAGSGTITGIDLEYSTDGGSTYNPIVTSTMDDGLYSWTVPDEDSNHCLVKATVYDDNGLSDTDVSNSSFEIIGIPPEPAENLIVEHYATQPVLDTSVLFSKANSEPTVNDYTDTHMSDDFYHEILEDDTVQGGSGKADLDVKYDISISSGTSPPFTLYIESYATTDESYSVSYTVNGGGGETSVITIPVSEDIRSYQISGVNPADTVNINIKDSSQNPRETVGAVYIDHLYIESAGSVSNTADNAVNWTASPDDGSGSNDVSYYEVLRCFSSDGSADESFQVTADGSESYSFVDSGAGTADNTRWWYMVRTVDSDGLYNDTNYIQEPLDSNSAPDAPTNPSPSDG